MDEKKFMFDLKNLQLFNDNNHDENPSSDQKVDNGNNQQQNGQTPKTFTQEEVNEMIVSRLSRENAKWLKLLGVEKKEDVEALVNNAKAHGELKAQFDALTKERDDLVLEKTNASYKRVAEKYTDEVDYVFSKVAPEKDEKIEDYEKRVSEFLNEHPSFLKSDQNGKGKISSTIIYQNQRNAKVESLKSALAERYAKK